MHSIKMTILVGMHFQGKIQNFIKTQISAIFEVGKQFATNIKDTKAT